MDMKFQKLAAESMNAPIDQFRIIDSETATRELDAMDFCAGIIAALHKEAPVEFRNHEFYRWTKQEEDIFVCWGTKYPISVQIDPHCAVIVALGNEFGSWTPKDNAVRSFIEAYRRRAAKSA